MRTSSNPPAATAPAADGSAGAAGTLRELADELVFRSPTENQRRMKARFWQRAADDPMLDAQNAPLDTIRKLTGSEAVGKWFQIPGFREWFLNKDEHREKLEYLFGLALDAAEQILVNQDPKAQSARVNVIKVLSELAGKFPTKNAAPKDSLSSAINQMDKIQLEAYLQKNGVTMQLSASKNDTITVTPIESEDTPE